MTDSFRARRRNLPVSVKPGQHQPFGCGRRLRYALVMARTDRGGIKRYWA